MWMCEAKSRTSAQRIGLMALAAITAVGAAPGAALDEPPAGSWRLTTGFAVGPLFDFGQTIEEAPPRRAQPDATLPPYLKDRGTGVPTTLFGTYIRRGELIVYPFFEYYRDRNFEYTPEELGFTGREDFRGRYRAAEGLLYFGYGVTDDIAVELEVAGIRASLEKSDLDPSGLPPNLEQSGLGDIDTHVLWRWLRETESRPEFYSFAKVAIPHRRTDGLIGTADWEVDIGTGFVRGFSWGTLTFRAAVEYAKGSESPFDVGEYAIEYLKRLSSKWRFYAAVEGTQDEVSLITEAQWHLSPHVFLKLNNGLGLTSKATDWEPEIGIAFILPTR
jgi:hypothetical protein